MDHSQKNDLASMSPLTPSLTRDQLTDDLRSIYLYMIRATNLLIGDDGAASGLLHRPLPADEDLLAGPEDYGLTFADIAHAEFVTAFLLMYDYAYFGRFQADAEGMGDETSYTRAASFIFDLQHATLPEQILQEEVRAAARRLTQVAETANARNILEEGYESFFHFSRGANDPDMAEEGSLTVRQLALLAGMTEMTIRTLANPKRPDALKTTSVDGRTRIEPAVAREWLKHKGKYVPVRRAWGGANVDLANARLVFIDDLTSLLNLRLQQLADETPGGAPALRKRLERSKPRLPFSETLTGLHLDLEREHFKDVNAISSLADILDMPGQLIALRARELIAREELNQVQRELEALKQQTAREGGTQ